MKIMTNRKWLLSVVAILLIFLVILNALAYIVDPFFQYRSKDNQYMINAKYCAAGLIKTYDYDTIMIGSSMIQNFDMDLFRETLNCSPLHIGIGGMTPQDTLDYIELANSVGKADTYYICVDISGFRNFGETKAISYLLKDDFISRMQYAISYESLFRFLPIDIAYMSANAVGFSLPKSLEQGTKIDKFGYWGNQYKYSEDIVINGWKNDLNSVSDVDTTNLLKNLKNGIDSFFSKLPLNNANYVFFFPPYSSLFWSDAQDKGYFDAYLDAKEYFIGIADQYGATVYDFQGADLTVDLNNYKDTTHYSPKINDWMTECFSQKEYLASTENCSSYREMVVENTKEFRNTHSSLFNNE